MKDRKFAEKFKEGYTVACGLEYAHDISDKDTYRYSREFEQRMQALADLIRNRKNRREKLYRIAKVASIFIVSFLLLAGTVKAVSAIVEWCVNKNDISTHISFEVPKGADVPQKIEKQYVISDLPEGYNLDDVVENPFLIFSTIKSKDGDYLYFSQYCYYAFNGAFDTENAEMLVTELNGKKAYSIEKMGTAQIVWEDGEYVFVLKSSGGLTLEDVRVLAENITVEEN